MRQIDSMGYFCSNCEIFTRLEGPKPETFMGITHLSQQKKVLPPNAKLIPGHLLKIDIFKTRQQTRP